MGDRVDEDGEKRDGQWQAFGEGIILKRWRPKADLINQENDAEDDGLGRENRHEDLQKG